MRSYGRRYLRRDVWNAFVNSHFFPVHAPALPAWAALLQAFSQQGRDRMDDLLGMPARLNIPSTLGTLAPLLMPIFGFA